MALSSHGLSVVENLSTSWARLRGERKKDKERHRKVRGWGGEKGEGRRGEGRGGERRGEEGRRGGEKKGRDKERRGKKQRRDEEERREEYILSTH